MTIKELANILKKYREQHRPVDIDNPMTPDEVRARELLEKLMVRYKNAYKERKRKWLERHPDKKVFEPDYGQEIKNITLDEWVCYFINRICISPHQRYYDTLGVGGTEEEARKEMNKTNVEVLHDYRDYQDYEKVLNIWTEGE